jgi:hypothetical protein
MDDAAHNLVLSGPEYFELTFFNSESPRHKQITRTLLYTRPQFSSIENPADILSLHKHIINSQCIIMHKTVHTVTINEIEEVSCTMTWLQKAMLTSDPNICMISPLSVGYAYTFIENVQYWLNEVGEIVYLMPKQI